MVEPWPSVALETVAQLNGGYAFKSEEYAPSGRFVLRTLNIGEDGRVNRNEAVFIPLEACAPYKRFELRAKDILFVMVGATLGKIGLVTERDLPALLNQNMWRVRAINDAIDQDFLYFAFKHRAAAGLVGASGSARSFVRRDDYRRLKIPFPPMKDQRDIASVLGALDDKIELNRRMNETLEAMARAIFKDWFVDFGPTRAKMEGRAPYLAPEIWALFPDRFDAEGKPDGWDKRSIYEIADVIYGAPFASSQFNTERRGAPLIRIRDLADESPSVWTPEAHPKGYKVTPGDIVVGMDGEFRAYLWGGAEAWLNQRVCVFAPKIGFSAAFVRNSIVDDLARIEATEVATTVIHLGKHDIDRFTALLPSKGIVTVFNDLAQPSYDRIVANKLEVTSLAATRDLLLPKLMSGEIRVKDAEKVVEAVA